MKIIRPLLAILCFLILIPDGKTQEVFLTKNSIFMEIMGNGGLLSINYERSFNASLYGRIGIATASNTLLGGGIKVTTIPILITYLIGNKSSHLEMGSGIILGNKNNYLYGSNTIVDLTAFLGYRYQAPKKGYLFRIGLTPFLSLDNKANYPVEGAFLSGGISFGYHF